MNGINFVFNHRVCRFYLAASSLVYRTLGATFPEKYRCSSGKVNLGLVFFMMIKRGGYLGKEMTGRSADITSAADAIITTGDGVLTRKYKTPISFLEVPKKSSNTFSRPFLFITENLQSTIHNAQALCMRSLKYNRGLGSGRSTYMTAGVVYSLGGNTTQKEEVRQRREFRMPPQGNKQLSHLFPSRFSHPDHLSYHFFVPLAENLLQRDEKQMETELWQSGEQSLTHPNDDLETP